MALWTSDKYIASIKKLSLSQKQTLSHGGSAQTHYQDKYAHMCARIDSVSYTRFDMGVILVYIQCDGCYPRIYPMRGWVYPRRTPVALVYPRRKSRINPSMGQLMVEGDAL